MNRFILKTFIISLLLGFVSSTIYAQFIDNYGFNVGFSLSNQTWIQKSSGETLFDAAFLPGFTVRALGEKEVFPKLSVRMETGYFKKGFTQSITLVSENGEWLGDKEIPLTMHHVSLGSALKISPLQRKVFPYIILGLRADYLLACEDATITEPISNTEYPVYKDQIEEFKKISWGALLGLGFSINNKVYFEFEANPTLGSVSKSDLQTIRNNYWAINVGLNINKQEVSK